MDNKREFFAIKVSQPYADFYQVVLKAELLLNLCFNNPAKEVDNEIVGIQRDRSISRAKEIAAFIDSNDAAFPNSIIISANFDEEDRLIDEKFKWRFESVSELPGIYKLIIPDITVKSCSIIDGQHRLLGFEYSRRKEFDLTCSIYDALPPSGQASLFSTINFNQRKVDKSLAYQLFGYSLDESKRAYWTPDLLAVYFSRKFNQDSKSPFYNKIKYRVEDEVRDSDWSVSSAAFIDGVLSLISKKPKQDRYKINNSFSLGDRGRGRLTIENDNSPLRAFFIGGNDLAIEQVLIIFFSEVKKIFWTEALVLEKTVLVRTVGIAALFDVLKAYVKTISKIDSEGMAKVTEYLNKVSPDIFLDANNFPASTTGRKNIFNEFMKPLTQLPSA